MATYVVTGANRGVGLELCRRAKDGGHEVIALCRTSSEDLDGLDVRVETGIDVGDDAVVDALRERLADAQVDVLINNAGVLSREVLDALDFDGIRKQFEVNALGPLRVTSALAENLHEGSKVAIITSRMGSIGDNSSGGSYGYRMSKAAVNMVGRSLAHDLKARGIAVALLHPGFVKTDMTGNRGAIDVKEAAGGIHARIDALTMETSGTFWHQNGEELPW